MIAKKGLWETKTSVSKGIPDDPRAPRNEGSGSSDKGKKSHSETKKKKHKKRKYRSSSDSSSSSSKYFESSYCIFKSKGKIPIFNVKGTSPLRRNSLRSYVLYMLCEYYRFRCSLFTFFLWLSLNAEVTRW